jgi:hypothetical protein
VSPPAHLVGSIKEGENKSIKSRGKWGMSDKFFIERREDKGDYAIRRPGSDRASDVCDTQKEAIERAREIDPGATVEVERVRNTDKGSRDKWRKP